jgi:DNA-nicking Smr family endonuclease
VGGKKGRKKEKRIKPEAGQPQRRGMRRSIRFDADDFWDEDKKNQTDPYAPPAIHLRMMRAEEALHKLSTELQTWQKQGRYEILVVHGKGQNSAQGISVLGPLVRQWCDDNGHIVSSWREAPRHWGGSGAVVVVLHPAN